MEYTKEEIMHYTLLFVYNWTKEDFEIAFKDSKLGPYYFWDKLQGKCQNNINSSQAMVEIITNMDQKHQEMLASYLFDQKYLKSAVKRREWNNKVSSYVSGEDFEQEAMLIDSAARGGKMIYNFPDKNYVLSSLYTHSPVVLSGPNKVEKELTDAICFIYMRLEHLKLEPNSFDLEDIIKIFLKVSDLPLILNKGLFIGGFNDFIQIEHEIYLRSKENKSEFISTIQKQIDLDLLDKELLNLKLNI